MEAKKFFKILISKLFLVVLVIGCIIGSTRYIKAASQEYRVSGMNWNISDRNLQTVHNWKSDNSSYAVIMKADKGTSGEEEFTMTLDMGHGRKQKVRGKYDKKIAYQVYKMVNKLRTNKGKSKLKWNSNIAKKAKIRAGEIAVVFDHTRPDGSSAISMDNTIFGENIAMGYSSAKEVMKGWTNSQGHYKNIISDNYDGLSVACFKYKDGDYYVPCWVQLFTIDKKTNK
jgi:uncharacterized protein YkwD